MKPIHLLQEELNYELRIRGIITTRKDASVKRKMLARALESERFRNITLVDPEYDSVQEIKTITDTLDSIRNLVVEFEGPENDSQFRRIKSRLICITNRIQRLIVPEEDGDVLKSLKNESLATCLELDALLYEKVATQASTSPSGNTTIVQPLFQAQNVGKGIPVYKWNLHFSGDDNFSLKSFLDRVDELSVARRVTKDDLFASAIDLFSGSALLWYRSIRQSVKDWDELVFSLKHHFLPSDYEDRLWDEIRTRTQGPKEPIHIYVAIMETLFSRTERPVSEVTKLKYIRKNLLPLYNVHLALTPVNTIKELVDFCHKIDEAQSTKHKYRAPACTASLEPELAYIDSSKTNLSTNTTIKAKQQTDTKQSVAKHAPNASGNTSEGKDIKHLNTDRSRTIVCWNCGQPNHVHADCRMRRRRFCYRCGKKNETVRTCRCSKN